MSWKKPVVIVLLLFVSITTFAQTVYSDSTRLAEYRIEIGLDLTVADFNTKSIDPKVLGPRLAGILGYFIENFYQSVYERKLCKILKEQNQALDKVEFEIAKIQFVSAKKVDDEITLLFTVWPSKNKAKVKQIELVFRFKDGVSESQATNELFSLMSRYVQQREQLQQQ